MTNYHSMGSPQGKRLPPAPIQAKGAEVGLHLVKEGVGAESNGDGIGHQQKGQQQLEGRMLQHILDGHANELLLLPGILGERVETFLQASVTTVAWTFAFSEPWGRGFLRVCSRRGVAGDHGV